MILKAVVRTSGQAGPRSISDLEAMALRVSFKVALVTLSLVSLIIPYALSPLMDNGYAKGTLIIIVTNLVSILLGFYLSGSGPSCGSAASRHESAGSTQDMALKSGVAVPYDEEGEEVPLSPKHRGPSKSCKRRAVRRRGAASAGT